MSKLQELLSDIDGIEDDQDFMEAENDLVRKYCIERNFNLSDEDMQEIKNRGLDDGFEFWKEEFKNKNKEY